MPFLNLTISRLARCSEPFTLPLRDQGLILIEGENRDGAELFNSNGSGKSVMFVDAPLWCLYDRLGRYGQRPAGDLLCHPTRGAEVSVGYERRGQALRITRARTAKGRPTFTVTDHDGQLVPLSKDPRRRTEDVSEILGMDFAACRAAVVVGGDVALAQAGFAVQMAALESMLGLAELSTAADLASQKARALAQQVAAAQAMQRAGQQAVALAEAFLAQTRAAASVDYEAELSVLAARLRESEDAAEALFEARRVLEKLTGERAAVSGQWAQLEQRAREIIRRRDELLTAARLTACPTCKRPYKTGKDLEVFKKQNAAQLKAAESEGRSVHARMEPLQKKIGALDGSLRQHGDVVQSLQDMAGRARDFRAQQEQLQRAQTAQVQQVKLAEQQVEIARVKLVEVEAGLTARSWDHWVQAQWMKWYGRDELQADLFRQAVPYLNEAAAEYSQRLTGGQITVAFDPERTSRNEDLIRLSGPTVRGDYALLSAGEKQRVNLIIAFSFRALARFRIGEHPGLGVFDEAFDGLDPQGLATVSELLSAEVSKGGTVIIISHRADFKELFPARRVLRVVRHRGEARVEGL